MAKETKQPKKPTTSLDIFKGSVEKAKTKFMTSFPEDEKIAEKIFQREKGFAVMAAMENTKLAICKPESVFTAVASVALTGLTLNPVLDLAYLIPRGGKCCLDIGYKGMIEVLTQSEKIKDIRCKAVFENDDFDYSEGTGDDYYLRHKPRLNRPDDEKIIATYSIATFPDGRERFHVLDYKKLMKHKAVAVTKNVWNAWEEEQCMKTVIRSHYKYLPKTEAATRIMKLADTANPVDLEQVEKEEAETTFEDAKIVDEATEMNEAIEAIEKAKTVSELQASVDCYPSIMELPAVKKAIKNKQSELKKKEEENKKSQSEKKESEQIEEKDNDPKDGELFKS